MQVVHRLTTSNPFAVIPSHPFMIDIFQAALRPTHSLYMYIYIRLWSGLIKDMLFILNQNDIYIYIYIESKQYITKRYRGVFPHSFFGQLPSGLNIHSCRKQSDP